MTTEKPVGFTLHFPELDRDITGHAGETIYQSARRSGVRIIGACGGRGTCGTCRVQIVAGEIDEANDKRLPAEKKNALGARLPSHAEIRLHDGDRFALASAGGAGRIRRRRSR